MAFNFLNSGKSKNQFLGLFKPEENTSQDNAIPPGSSGSSSGSFSVGGTTPITYDTPMMDMYKKSLEDMPDEANYHSSIGRKILAGIAGATTGDAGEAFKTTKGIIDEPYESDLSRWKNKTGTTGELASLEERSNASKANNTYDWLKYQDERSNNQSLADLREEQKKNLEDEINHRGEDTFSDLLNGTRTRVSKNGNTLWSIRNNQTPQEKNNSELSLANGKEELRASTEKMLIGARGTEDRNTHAANRSFDNMHLTPKFDVVHNDLTGTNNSVNVNDPDAVAALGKTQETAGDKESSENRKAAFRAELERDNAKYKSELDKLSETQKSAAYDQALKETLIEGPNFSQFFTNGQFDGSKVTAKNQDVYNAMLTEVRNKLNFKFNKKGQQNPLAPRGNAVQPKVITDDDAKKELTKRGKIVTPDSIAQAKKLLEAGTQ